MDARSHGSRAATTLRSAATRVRRPQPAGITRHSETAFTAHAHQRPASVKTAAINLQLAARKAREDWLWRPPSPGACRSKR